MNTSIAAMLLAAIAATTSIAVLLMGPGEPTVVKVPDRIRLEIDQVVTKHRPPTEPAPQPSPTATLFAPLE